MPKGVSWWHLLADAALIALGFLVAHTIRFASGWIAAPLGSIPLAQWMALAALSIATWLLIFALHGLYYSRLKQSASAEVGALTHAVAEGLVATILLTFLLRELPDSRLALMLAIGLSWLYLVAYRLLARKLRRQRPRAAVVGESSLAKYLARQFAARANRFELAGAYPSVSDLELAGVDAVFCDAKLAEALWQVLPPGPQEFSVHLLPEGASTGGAALSVATVEGVPTFSFKSAPDLAMMRAAKRVVDLVAGVVLLALSLPLWLIAVVGIKLSMPGPVFYFHERLGVGGRTFKNIKFRSMKLGVVLTAEQQTEFAREFKLANDPRITPFGKFLRKSSIDELPQLLNVLRGDCSLVGPRAIVASEVEKYGEWRDLLLTVPPGLTGLWQVSGRSATSYQQRIDFDLYYINNWSIGLDLLIIARTIPAVLSRKGAV